MNYEQELGVILDGIPKENLSFFTKDIKVLSKREFSKLWPELNVEEALLLVSSYREEVPEVWGVLPEDAITLEEEVNKGICFECGSEVNDDMFRCITCNTPLEWEDMPEFAEATETTVMKSLGDKEKEVSTLVDTP